MFFFFKQKTAYEMRISDWSSDVCSSDLGIAWPVGPTPRSMPGRRSHAPIEDIQQQRPDQQDGDHAGAARRAVARGLGGGVELGPQRVGDQAPHRPDADRYQDQVVETARSEANTSDLQ